MKYKLYGLKMPDEGDLVQHANSFNLIIGNLMHVDVNIEHKDKVMVLLSSQPSAYENIFTALTCDKDTIKLEIVIATLLSHDDSSKRSQGDGLRETEREVVKW